MKYLLTLALAGILLASSFTAAVAEGSFFDGVPTDIVYLYSFDNSTSAGAVRASIPLIAIPERVVGTKITFNVDALGVVEDQGDTKLRVGASATIQGLSVGAFTAGVTYIPSANYGFTGYIALTPIRF